MTIHSSLQCRAHCCIQYMAHKSTADTLSAAAETGTMDQNRSHFGAFNGRLDGPFAGSPFKRQRRESENLSPNPPQHLQQPSNKVQNGFDTKSMLYLPFGICNSPLTLTHSPSHGMLDPGAGRPHPFHPAAADNAVLALHSALSAVIIAASRNCTSIGCGW